MHRTFLIRTSAILVSLLICGLQSGLADNDELKNAAARIPVV